MCPFCVFIHKKKKKVSASWGSNAQTQRVFCHLLLIDFTLLTSVLSWLIGLLLYSLSLTHFLRSPFCIADSAEYFIYVVIPFYIVLISGIFPNKSDLTVLTNKCGESCLILFAHPFDSGCPDYISLCSQDKSALQNLCDIFAICMCSHCAGVCTTSLHGVGWVLPENELRNWGMYQRITCGLTQPRGFWESGRVCCGGLSFENCKSCE